MKTRNKFIIVTIVALFLVVSNLPITALADDWYEEEEGYFTLYDEDENELTIMAREIFLQDEYISEDNKHYTVTKVDKEKKTAYAKFLGEVELPDVEEVEALNIITAALQQDQEGKILLYCTHSDESYLPSDGKPSIPGKGGIFDVAQSFREALNNKGIDAVLDKTPHDPHDAGAYRRSRQTAVDLIRKNMPVAAVFDIHRDAVPKEVYDTQVNGEYISKVRIVVGKRNQNRQANQELAYKIKAVADKIYPGLIKDIYIGKGMYNQELSPRSLLFECGSFEGTKEAAQKSMVYMADVISRAIYGGTAQAKTQKGENRGEYKINPIDQETNQGTQGGGKGILWIIAIIVAGAVLFLLFSSGGREMFSKISKTSREEFSSFLGRKKRK